MDNDNETHAKVGDISVPIDPMDLMQCESCQ